MAFSLSLSPKCLFDICFLRSNFIIVRFISNDDDGTIIPFFLWNGSKPIIITLMCYRPFYCIHFAIWWFSIHTHTQKHTLDSSVWIGHCMFFFGNLIQYNNIIRVSSQSESISNWIKISNQSVIDQHLEWFRIGPKNFLWAVCVCWWKMWLLLIVKCTVFELDFLS